MSMQNLSVDSKVPEDMVLDTRACLGVGYGESKYVVERLLASSGIEGCTARIPQLYGEYSRAPWPVTGWLPYLVVSGVSMKQLAFLKGTATWLPMDVAAKATLDIAFYNGALPLAVNVFNPRPIPNSTIFASIQQAIYDRSQGKMSLPLVSLKQWLLNTRTCIESGMPRSKLPALKLPMFFQNIADGEDLMDDDHEVARLPSFDTTIAQQISPSLKNVRPLRKDVVYKWVDYWIQEGLLPDVAPRNSVKL